VPAKGRLSTMRCMLPGSQPSARFVPNSLRCVSKSARRGRSGRLVITRIPDVRTPPPAPGPRVEKTVRCPGTKVVGAGPDREVPRRALLLPGTGVSGTRLVVDTVLGIGLLERADSPFWRRALRPPRQARFCWGPARTGEELRGDTGWPSARGPVGGTEVGHVPAFPWLERSSKSSLESAAIRVNRFTGGTRPRRSRPYPNGAKR
jgi:hypothetical protein